HFNNAKNARALLPNVRTYFAANIVSIAIATIVLVPLVNAGSRRLGFGHGGISFVSGPAR
ncbi:MAG TPA: hypothetical protein VJA94_00935, partial [Candidatus Angelobacter sp.]